MSAVIGILIAIGILLSAAIATLKENLKRFKKKTDMKTAKKYKLTDETIQVSGHTLHRIEALTDFCNAHKGEKGGFVESEDNLSQSNDCWVYDDAKVFSNAMVSDDALVFGNAQVYDKARVFGVAFVFNDAVVCGDAEVRGNARVFGKAIVYDDAEVCGYAEVSEDALVYKDAKICGNARVLGNASIWGNAKIWGNASISDNVRVYDNARVSGNARVYGNAKICGDAKVESASDYIVFKNWWSSGRYFTWTRSNNMWSVGCFYGKGEELIAKAYKDSELSGREYERVVKYVESILKDNENDKR